MAERPPFPLLGEPLAVDLANTIVVERGELTDLLVSRDDLRSWLAAQEHRLPQPRATEECLRTFLELRSALALLFEAAMTGERPDVSALDTVNELSGAAACVRSLHWPVGADPTVHDELRAPSDLARATAVIARSGIELLGGRDRTRLRRCEGPRCVLLFVATKAQRRWCSPSVCGNRVRVARHYHRQHRDKSQL